MTPEVGVSLEELYPYPVGSVLAPGGRHHNWIVGHPEGVWRVGELVGVERTSMYLVSEVLCVKDNKIFLYVPWKVFSSIPGLYPQMPVTLTQSGQPKMSPDTAKYSLGSKITALENYCFRQSSEPGTSVFIYKNEDHFICFVELCKELTCSRKLCKLWMVT